jgi:hypothetical protein
MRWSLFLVAALLTSCGRAEGDASENRAPEAKVPRLLALSKLEGEADSSLQKAQQEEQQKALQGRAKSAMEAYLFDPFSARFRNLRTGRGGALCGEVNAKNRMGAYVGFKDFVIGKDRSTVYMSNYSDGVRSEMHSSFADAYVNVCANDAEVKAYRLATNYYESDYSVPTTPSSVPSSSAEQGCTGANAYLPHCRPGRWNRPAPQAPLPRAEPQPQQVLEDPFED